MSQLTRRTLPAVAAASLLCAAVAARAADPAPVTLTDNGDTWVLDNGIVKATINKKTSNMPSLIYKGIPIVGRSEFWEQVPSGEVTSTVTIDPSKNGGERAEVVAHAVRGTDAQVVPDLPEGRRIAAVVDRGLDVLEDGALTIGELLHGNSRLRTTQGFHILHG